MIKGTTTGEQQLVITEMQVNDIKKQMLLVIFVPFITV
jgi:hypothetical protein